MRNALLAEGSRIKILQRLNQLMANRLKLNHELLKFPNTPMFNNALRLGAPASLDVILIFSKVFLKGRRDLASAAEQRWTHIPCCMNYLVTILPDPVYLLKRFANPRQSPVVAAPSCAGRLLLKADGHAMHPIPGLAHKQGINVVAETPQDSDAFAHHLLQQSTFPNDLADKVVKLVRTSELHQ